MLLFPVLFVGAQNVVAAIYAKTRRRFDQRLLRAAIIFVFALTLLCVQKTEGSERHSAYSPLLSAIAFQLSFNLFAAIALSAVELIYHSTTAVNPEQVATVATVSPPSPPIETEPKLELDLDLEDDFSESVKQLLKSVYETVNDNLE